jgi:hypothetical protein
METVHDILAVNIIKNLLGSSEVCGLEIIAYILISKRQNVRFYGHGTESFDSIKVVNFLITLIIQFLEKLLQRVISHNNFFLA